MLLLSAPVKTNQWRSRFKRPDEEVRQPLRLSANDLEILKLFGPQEFRYATAEMIAALTGRYLNYVQHRLRSLWEHGFLQRWFPPNERVGGSTKAVYFLDQKGADVVSDQISDVVDAPSLDLQKYHPFMEHTLTVNWFRALTISASRMCDGVKLLYQYRDRELKMKVQSRSIVPDWFFAIGGEKGVRNFFVEVQRSTRKTKEGTAEIELVKTVKDKFRDYYQFYTWACYEQYPNDEYPNIEHLRNMRVLVVTDTGEGEHENLLRLARSVDEKGKGLRLFWFARKKDFDIGNPKTLFEPIWRTPVEGDEPKSIFK